MIIGRCRGIARAAALVAAMAGFVAIGVGAVVLAPSAARAQFTVQIPEGLEIPDLPCMTHEEHLTLRDISNEYNNVTGQMGGVQAELDQIWPEVIKYTSAEKAISKFQHTGGGSVSMREYEAALETAHRLRPVDERDDVLRDARDKLLRRQKLLRAKFNDLLRPIRSRRCPPPAPVEIEPGCGSLPNKPGSPPAIPCSFEGPYVGLHGTVFSGGLWTTENFALTGEQTNHFSNPASSAGGGVQIGYNYFPWRDSLYPPPDYFLCWQYLGIGGEISLDGLGQRNRQVFSAETFLGTRTDFRVSALAKFAFAPNPNFMLYNVFGWTGVRQQLQINFGPLFNTNESRFTSGLTIGTGFEFRLPGFNLAGQPLAFYALYEHTFLQAARLDRPPASRDFTYRFRGDENSLKIGFNVSLNR